MKTNVLTILVLLFSISSAFAQNPGTLKIFSEEPVVVYVDEVQHPVYSSITLPAGTHYVKALNKEGAKVYSNIVTITSGEVTTILVDGSGIGTQPAAATGTRQVTQEAAAAPKGTGTLNIFSEFTGTTVYLDDLKQGEDIKVINAVPAGNHYLKVIKDGVGIFGELIVINPGQTTSVLIKNDGQVAERIMESKSKEREEYQAKKVDVIFTSNSVSTTQGASTLFPGFYGYYGYSSSVTNTSQISDFKIIQGGVKEIGDLGLANLVKNQNVISRHAAVQRSVTRMTSIAAGLVLGAVLIGGPVIVDLLVDKPFLHPAGTTAPDWEIGVATAGIVSGVVGYGLIMAAEKQYPKHYYSVDEAAKDAQEHNRKLKEKLGLPEGYDVK